MPCRNRLALALTISALTVGSSLAETASHPYIVGFERFHSQDASIEGGRLLFNELGCVNCHEPATGLPEKKGPSLMGILQRNHPTWVKRFLLSPAESKSEFATPHVSLTDREVEATLHYLASIRTETKIPDAFKFVNADRGADLYHTLGCIACHAPSASYNSSETSGEEQAFTYDSVPLLDLNQKYDIHSLTAYLFNPYDTSPHGRMPQFSLEREDGGDIAAFLLESENGDATEYPRIDGFEFDSSTAQLGLTIVRSNQCSRCHQLPDTATDPKVTASKIHEFESLPKDHIPYSLNAIQAKSIHLFLKSPLLETPAETHLESLNCLACHDRNGRGGPDLERKAYFKGDTDLGDTGRYPPPLSEIGRKLKPQWLAEAIKGKKRVRPYLATQMPVFQQGLESLAKRLIHADGPTSDQTHESASLEAGRKLLGSEGGLNCITCHGWKDRSSLGISALNLGNLSERLQFEWFHDYLIDPAAYRPDTLMPSFWPQGVATNQEILQGDTDSQIASLYAFSEHGEGLPEGFPAVGTTAYEIVPKNRPIVQRSFFEGVGTQALLIGFPEGIHLAIDGRTGRPALMWKGRFFDAYRTWFSRFPDFEKPLGTDLRAWPKWDDPVPSQYRGYRYANDGIPEIISELNGAVIYERLQPVRNEEGEMTLKRTIRCAREGQIENLSLRHPANVHWIEIQEADPLTRSFIYQW